MQSKQLTVYWAMTDQDLAECLSSVPLRWPEATPQQPRQSSQSVSGDGAAQDPEEAKALTLHSCYGEHQR